MEVIQGLPWFRQRVGKGDTAAYLVQIVNKPDHIIAVEVWWALLIPLPVKYVADLVVKVG